MSEEIKAKFSVKPLAITVVMAIVLGLLFCLADYMFCCGTVRAAMGVIASQMGAGFAKIAGLKCGFGNSLMYSLQWFFGGLIYILTTIVFLAAAFFGSTYRPANSCCNKILAVIPQIVTFVFAIAVAVIGVWTGVDMFRTAVALWWEGFWVTFNGIFQFLISIVMIILNVLAVGLSGFFLVKRIAK